MLRVTNKSKSLQIAYKADGGGVYLQPGQSCEIEDEMLVRVDTGIHIENVVPQKPTRKKNSTKSTNEGD